MAHLRQNSIGGSVPQFAAPLPAVSVPALEEEMRRKVAENIRPSPNAMQRALQLPIGGE